MNRRALRWCLWLVLLVGLAWLVATDPRRAPEPAVADVPRAAARPQTFAMAASAQAESVKTDARAGVAVRELVPRERLMTGRRPAVTGVDLFASHSWAPPPPLPAAAPADVPPPAAAVPPPFTFLGKRRDEQGWQVYLGRGDLALIVREGETIEGGYRIESIRPPTLTLVRADIRQQIAIGEWE